MTDYELSNAKKYMAKKRLNAKENNLCIICFNPIEKDRIGKTICQSCTTKRNKYSKESRQFFASIGICPRCTKNKIIGDEKSCIECRAIDASRKQKFRENNRASYNEYSKEYQKKAYRSFIDKGLCPRCSGKRKIDPGYKSCSICRAKSRDKDRIARYSKKIKEKRIEKGLCVWCDNPIKSGYKICEYHYNMNIEKLNNEKCRNARNKIKSQGLK